MLTRMTTNPWIKTKHLYENDYYELINVETGFYIYMTYVEKYKSHGVYQARTYNEKGESYGNCLYMGTEDDCEKVIEKFAQKLGVHHEVNPDTYF